MQHKQIHIITWSHTSSQLEEQSMNNADSM